LQFTFLLMVCAGGGYIGYVILVAVLLPLESEPMEAMFCDPFMVKFILALLPINSIVEEAMRLSPIALVIFLTKNESKGTRNGIIWSMTVITAVIFGMMHVNITGSILKGVLIQGVCGLLFNVLYLRTGGLDGKAFVAYMACVITHTAVNYSFAALMFLGQILLWHTDGPTASICAP